MIRLSLYQRLEVPTLLGIPESEEL
jgi:hypothetical protein